MTLVLFSYVPKKIFTELLGLLNLFRIGSTWQLSVFGGRTRSIFWDLRDVQIHLLITFLTSSMLHETRSTTLDLNTASRFLLNMFDVCASMTHNLGAEVEARKWLQVYWDTLFWPFALEKWLAK